jgi:prolyl-tRNA editing enzyme YbaK/EbsC (Cys-tRNA(Pro) deacylase)
VERFEAAARAAGVEPAVVRFDDDTRTAADAARAIGCEVGQIVKSLVFVADGVPFLALTSGPNRADPVRLEGILGADEVRRASPDEARAATGFAIGGTPPFGHPQRLRTVIDRDLFEYDEVWAAAGSPDSVFPIGPAMLAEATGGRPGDFAER